MPLAYWQKENMCHMQGQFIQWVIMDTGPGAHAHMGPMQISQKYRENKHFILK